MSFITLTTDFGTKDHFVGAVKGAILSQLPDAKIVDISHEISPFNIAETAYILKNSPNVKIVIHRDRDYNNDEEVQKIIDDYHDNITYHFITDGTDVESHLLNPKHLSFVHPELTEDKAEELINKSIEDSFIKSRRKYVNSLTDKSLKNKSGHKAADNVELAEENLRGNPKKYSHGKIVVGDLKSKIQQEIKKNPNLFSPSPYIASPIFDKIKSDLWE